MKRMILKTSEILCVDFNKTVNELSFIYLETGVCDTIVLDSKHVHGVDGLSILSMKYYAANKGDVDVECSFFMPSDGIYIKSLYRTNEYSTEFANTLSGYIQDLKLLEDIIEHSANGYRGYGEWIDKAYLYTYSKLETPSKYFKHQPSDKLYQFSGNRDRERSNEKIGKELYNNTIKVVAFLVAEKFPNCTCIDKILAINVR